MPVDQRTLMHADNETTRELECEKLVAIVNRTEEFLAQLEKHAHFRNGDSILERTRVE